MDYKRGLSRNWIPNYVVLRNLISQYSIWIINVEFVSQNNFLCRKMYSRDVILLLLVSVYADLLFGSGKKEEEKIYTRS